ncbi:MAG: LamG-like jellyroll fold domain-containing protein [Lutibacter sp.]|nr:LamG-like jellyroll fold domain-containing protein [Lutibacter sp.]
MKKTILLLVICLWTFETFSQIIMDSDTFEKSVASKKNSTNRDAEREDKKTLNIAAENANNPKKLNDPIKAKHTTAAASFDSDGDGIFDNIDIDDDNDGLKDLEEENFCRNSPIASIGIFCDTDNDGIPNIFDLDSDNDGIPDVVEAGLGNLSNGTGLIAVTWEDVNGNGMHDAAEAIIINAASIPDTDGDGVPNYLDLDSDNDSVFDVDESGAENTNAVEIFENGDGDINGDGVGDGPDSDFGQENDVNSDGISEYYTDGILDIYDYFNGTSFYTSYGNSNQGTSPLFAKDTDNNGIPDYMDTKSNGTTFDISGTLYANLDVNNDGLIDGNVDVDLDGIVDAFDTNITVFGSPRDLNQKLHVYFDGRNDYIEEDNGTNIVNGLTEATMMAWVKLDPNFMEHGAIMGQSNFWMRINGTKRLRVEIQDNISVLANLPLLILNKWTHVATIYNGSDPIEKVKLYINGEKVTSTNPAGIGSVIETTGTNTKFRIGRNPSNTDITNSTAELFKGEMDEVRVFNKALTEEELQKMVYQELNDVNGFNSGVVIPREISPTIGANLVRYYRMDVFKDDIVDNLTTPSLDVLGAKMYNFKNIYPQTAPLPFETKADGDWSNVASWLHGDVWDIASEATNKDWSMVHVKNDLTTSNRHSTVGLIVDSGKKLSIKGSQELKNTWYLELDGIIDLEDESQLVQTSESILDQDSGGFIERDQQGTSNSFNYNYWSSSVGTITPLGINQRGTGIPSINESYLLKNALLDGTDAVYPNKNGPINFLPEHWAADSGVTSPITVSTYWLYTFNGPDNDYWSWKSIDQNTLLLAGEGYTMKGTSGGTSIAAQQNYVFKGKPNNGDFTLPIAKGNDRLVGNPYPSAMDADEFIKDNIGETDGGRNLTGNIFNGALYFWDHFGEINTHVLREYVGGYATYTLMGGAKAIASDTRINTTSGILSWKEPQQYIPVNQGFFVIAALELNPASTYTTTEIHGGDIVFKNSQRIFMAESLSNSVFMKGGNAKPTQVYREKDPIENIPNLDKRPKIWLLFDSPTGYHRQLLVGVDENTTNNFNLGYDAPIADINKEDMFWIFDGSKFVIQGVNNFDSTQELSLGIIVSKTGLARIKIDKLKNMDENISAYIKDKLTGEIHNISKKPFEINLEAGTYSERFSLIFKMQKLVDEDIAAAVLIPAEIQPTNESIHVFMNNIIGAIQIKNNGNNEITSIDLFNYLGQTMKTWNANFNISTISLPINIATGVYFVQINTKNGKMRKKIVVE